VRGTVTDSANERGDATQEVFYLSEKCDVPVVEYSIFKTKDCQPSHKQQVNFNKQKYTECHSGVAIASDVEEMTLRAQKQIKYSKQTCLLNLNLC
jgi:hypothetical protein